MTTAASPTAIPLAASATRGRAVPQATRAVRYAVTNTSVMLRDGAFVGFTVALPVVMFLMFNSIYGKQDGGTAGVAIMTNMAAYGALGGALNAGAVIQTERSNGWLRQLTVAGLNPRGFLIGKIVAALVVILPALIAVFAVGMTIGGIDIPVTTALAGILALWVSLLPMILLGLVLGLSIPPRAVQGASTIVLMGLSIVGGLWFPYEIFPSWLKAIAQFTPTYGIGKVGSWATLGGDFPTQPVLVIGIWTLALVLLSGVLFRRAARGSRR